jgi:NAD(P)-dependent dehydrogenase (short-subunit alcohol dehydrogenase family)
MTSLSASRTVLITGATSGIGLVSARLLSNSGWNVIATARSEEKAAILRTALTNIDVLVADFDQPDAVDAVVTALGDRRIDALINNAGFALPGAVEDVTPERARHQYEINVFAPIFLSRALIPQMRANGGGRIINVSSVSGLITGPMLGWYSSSKHALESLSDALRLELRPFGISVSLIEPNSFGTDIWSRAATLFPNAEASAYASFYRRADRLLNRTYPEPTPVAEAILEALTADQPKARYLVGKGTAVFPIIRRLPTKVSDYLIATSLGLRKPHPVIRRLLRMIGA